MTDIVVVEDRLPPERIAEVVGAGRPRSSKWNMVRDAVRKVLEDTEREWVMFSVTDDKTLREVRNVFYKYMVAHHPSVRFLTRTDKEGGKLDLWVRILPED